MKKHVWRDIPHGTFQNRRPSVYSVKFVLTVPFGGAIGGIQAVQALAGSPPQVLLQPAGVSGPWGPTATASPARPLSPAKKLRRP